jgi:hypothetical protein
VGDPYDLEQSALLFFDSSMLRCVAATAKMFMYD